MDRYTNNDFTPASEVRITRADGTREVRRPYSKTELRETKKGKRPSGRGKTRRRLTGAEIYPDFAQHEREWLDEVKPRAERLISSATYKHQGEKFPKSELLPFAEDGALRAFLQWKGRHTSSALVDGALDPRLRSWIATEADRDVVDGIRILRRAEQPLFERGELPDRSDAFSWLDQWLNWEEMKVATGTVPDPIDQILIQAAYLMVHYPEELETLSLGTPPFPERFSFAHKSERWMIEWTLVWLFSPWGSFHICALEIMPRLRRAIRWINLYRASEGDTGTMPPRDGGGRSWTGQPRGVRDTCQWPTGSGWGVPTHNSQPRPEKIVEENWGAGVSNAISLRVSR